MRVRDKLVRNSDKGIQLNKTEKKSEKRKQEFITQIALNSYYIIHLLHISLNFFNQLPHHIVMHDLIVSIFDFVQLIEDLLSLYNMLLCILLVKQVDGWRILWHFNGIVVVQDVEFAYLQAG